MKKIVLLSVFAISYGLCGFVMACEKPAGKPEIPDPTTAATAQMVKANNEIKSYVAEMTEYLNCARMSSREQRREVRKLEDFAAEFNEAIRIFRNRNS